MKSWYSNISLTHLVCSTHMVLWWYRGRLVWCCGPPPGTRTRHPRTVTWGRGQCPTLRTLSGSPSRLRPASYHNWPPDKRSKEQFSKNSFHTKNNSSQADEESFVEGNEHFRTLPTPTYFLCLPNPSILKNCKFNLSGFPLTWILLVSSLWW